MRSKRLKQKHVGQPILVLSNLARIVHGKYSQGVLIVPAGVHESGNGFLDLLPRAGSRAAGCAVIKNGELVEHQEFHSYPYDRKVDEVAIGLEEIADNLKKIVNGKTGQPVYRSLMEDVGSWYGRTLISEAS